MAELGRRAAELGLEIVLELEPFPLSLVNTVDTMVRFLDDVGVPSVQANIDISHLVLSHVRAGGNPQAGGARGARAHVRLRRQSSRRSAAGPRRGAVRALPARDQELELGDRAISIELEYSPEPERIVEWVEEAYRETDKLMRAQELRG